MIDNTDEIIYSSELIDQLEEMKSDLVDNYNDYLEEHNTNLDEDEEPEMAIEDFDEIVELEGFIQRYKSEHNDVLALVDFVDNLEGYGDFEHGEAIIHRDHFENYCKEMVQEWGYLPNNIPHWLTIDWEDTAENLEADYITSDFDGQEYLMRA